jgi:hypothetical protein
MSLFINLADFDCYCVMTTRNKYNEILVCTRMLVLAPITVQKFERSPSPPFNSVTLPKQQFY